MKKHFIPTLLLLIITSFLLTACQSSDPMSKPFVAVNGSSSIKAEPDLVEVEILVATEAADETAQMVNAEKTEKVVNYLKEIGIQESEIKTIRMNFEPNIKRENGKSVNLGYRAENYLQVKTKNIELISRIVDGSIINGAERIRGLNFSLSDEGKEALMDGLIGSAVNDAKIQAESAVNSLGQSIGGVKSMVVIKEYSSPIYRSMNSVMEDSLKEIASTPILPGELDYTIDVAVEFFISK